MFRFKQFIVHDESCAMKVGTDGVLLGAWAPLPNSQLSALHAERSSAGKNSQPNSPSILDVGTGSGLIALMLAQRTASNHAPLTFHPSPSTILAIDIDPAAVSQARENFAASPWANRLEARLSSLQDLANSSATSAFQLIVSNPPYFVDSLKNPDASRAAARHTDTLPFSELLACSKRLLATNGTLALILPAEAEPLILRLAAENGLTPYLITRVHTRANKPPKRVLLALSNHAPSTLNHPSFSSLVLIEDESGAPRSAAYQQLCKEFYL